MRHGHPIDNRQQMIRHARHQVRVQHLVHQIVNTRSIEVLKNFREGVGVLDLCACLLGEQLLFGLVRESQKRHALRVAFAGLEK